MCPSVKYLYVQITSDTDRLIYSLDTLLCLVNQKTTSGLVQYCFSKVLSDTYLFSFILYPNMGRSIYWENQMNPFFKYAENLMMEELDVLTYWHKGLLQEFTETNASEVSVCNVQYFLAGKSSSVSYFQACICLLWERRRPHCTGYVCKWHVQSPCSVFPNFLVRVSVT